MKKRIFVVVLAAMAATFGYRVFAKIMAGRVAAKLAQYDEWEGLTPDEFYAKVFAKVLENKQIIADQLRERAAQRDLDEKDSE